MCDFQLPSVFLLLINCTLTLQNPFYIGASGIVMMIGNSTINAPEVMVNGMLFANNEIIGSVTTTMCRKFPGILNVLGGMIEVARIAFDGVPFSHISSLHIHGNFILGGILVLDLLS